MAYRTIFRPDLLAGQAVIVTGGGSGIGRCTAHELAALGAKVALVGRKLEKLEIVRDEIAQAGGVASCHACDIRQEEAVAETVREALAMHGRIDGLVNNAGGQFPSPLQHISLKGWEAVVKTNLTGGFLMARECLNQWMQNHGGSIVNIVADMWGSMPGMGHSGAARAGMVSFTETAALEWAHYGVRVNAVAPGYVASSGMDSYPPEMGPILRGAAKGVPLKRMSTEAEISAGIVYLLSEAASFITGTTLRIDGGRPQMRAGWAAGQDEIAATAAVQAYNGFPLAIVPKVLQEK
ncbi:SDR family oxidoreductase [Undibacterium terreum]|uniref:Peroxisomal trans-2-enoyl-CoA reductase n=1 Tax=Undibacterium terreum TaxID=1224302 RepID=A0A916UF92_9BURK|nr:SDR family oxidoreductase [Undibacterium terreum]GGC69775.1 citronellol catabolism dehydrogenase [Undibacterium terreum]